MLIQLRRDGAVVTRTKNTRGGYDFMVKTGS
jgi:hypothetical protein